MGKDRDMRKTKIICTLGPATEDDGVLRQLMTEGMNVARFNFSHGDHAQHARNLERVRSLREELDFPLPPFLIQKDRKSGWEILKKERFS